MGFKVLELNASSTRSGRQVLANLREATQSHSVKKREKASEEECLKNLNSKKINNKVVSNDKVPSGSKNKPPACDHLGDKTLSGGKTTRCAQLSER